MAVMTPHAAMGGPGGGGSGLLSGMSALVAVVAACLVALCAAAALFVFRTPLRVWLHSRYGLRVLGGGAAGVAGRKDCVGGGGGDRLYDALVSCSIKDQGRRDEIRLTKEYPTVVQQAIE